MFIPGLLVLAVFVVVVVVLAWRHNEVFLISIRRGKLLLVRGSAPPGLLHDFGRVARETATLRARVRAIRSESHTRLVVDGTDEAAAQRLRNIFCLYPLSQLRAAVPARRNLGQVVGWTFLAWLLLPPDR